MEFKLKLDKTVMFFFWSTETKPLILYEILKQF